MRTAQELSDKTRQGVLILHSFISVSVYNVFLFVLGECSDMTRDRESRIKSAISRSYGRRNCDEIER